jgi:hypothetical protein
MRAKKVPAVFFAAREVEGGAAASRDAVFVVMGKSGNAMAC